MQIDLFDVLYEDFIFDKDKPIRVVELFSGIGFQSMGMELAEVPYEVVAISEIDKFAILSYASIHTDYLKIRDDYDFELSKDEMVETLQSKNVGYNFSSGRHTITKNTNIEAVKDYFLADKLSNNLGDISLLKGSDFPKDIDVMTYSFPCQDLSKAGKQAGLGEGTRSGLVYEVLRILKELKEINNLPKVPIMENVVDLIQAKFIDAWNKIAYEIERLGYTNYTQTLNAKEYGIAQNRDRVFMVSILGEYNYNFPKGFELEYRLKDYLEDEVDEKYYLSDDLLKHIEETGSKTTNFIQYDRYKGEFENLCRAWLGLSPTIHTKSNEIKVVENEDALKQQELRTHLKIKEATTKGYKEAYDGDGVYINRPHQKRGVVQDGMIQTLKTSGNDVGVVVGSYNYGSSDNYMKGKSRLEKNPDISNTIITSPNVGLAIADNRFHQQALETTEELVIGSGQKNAFKGSIDGTCSTFTSAMGMGGGQTPMVTENNRLRIRKLTPRETGRLMGMQDYQIDKQGKVTSNAQMYKQHGNGIVAQVIGLIIGMAYYDDEIELREKVMANSHMWIKEKGLIYEFKIDDE